MQVQKPTLVDPEVNKKLLEIQKKTLLHFSGVFWLLIHISVGDQQAIIYKFFKGCTKRR